MTKNNYKAEYKKYLSMVDNRLKQLVPIKKPHSIYEPIRYILNSGGKRLRAIFTLLACNLVGGKASQALDAATAIELLHQFTLVHDDIMDNALVRRGVTTIHKKWDLSTAILAGDQIMAKGFEILYSINSPKIHEITKIYINTFVEVCEGQALDMEYGLRSDVTIDDYYEMISKKTAHLFSASLKIGGLIGNGGESEIFALERFGKLFGRAFQISDDLLDLVGTQEEFGKKIGGDLREGKKTFLLLKAMERANSNERKILESIKPGNTMNQSKINKIRNIYQQLGTFEAAQDEISTIVKDAEQALLLFRQNQAKVTLLALLKQLIKRRV